MRFIDRIRLVPLAAGLAMAASAHADDILVGAPIALTRTVCLGSACPAAKASTWPSRKSTARRRSGPDKLKLMIEDTGSDKGQAITLVNRFALRDKALLVLGPSSSVEGIAVGPVANELKVRDAFGDCRQRTPSARPARGPSRCRPARRASSTTCATTRSRMACARWRWSRHATTTAQPHRRKRRAAASRRLRYRSCSTNRCSRPTAISSRSCPKLIAAKPQAVFMGLGGEQAANFVVQARQNGIDPKVQFMGGPAMGAAQFLTIGGAAIENTIYPADYFVGGTSAENKEFVAAFQKKYGPPARLRCRARLCDREDRRGGHQGGRPEAEPRSRAGRPEGDRPVPDRARQGPHLVRCQPERYLQWHRREGQGRASWPPPNDATYSGAGDLVDGTGARAGVEKGRTRMKSTSTRAADPAKPKARQAKTQLRTALEGRDQQRPPRSGPGAGRGRALRALRRLAHAGARSLAPARLGRADRVQASQGSVRRAALRAGARQHVGSADGDGSVRHLARGAPHERRASDRHCWPRTRPAGSMSSATTCSATSTPTAPSTTRCTRRSATPTSPRRWPTSGAGCAPTGDTRSRDRAASRVPSRAIRRSSMRSLRGMTRGASAAMRDHISGGLTFLDFLVELPNIVAHSEGQ